MRYPLRLLALLLTAGLSGCTELPFHPSATLFATPATVGLAYEDVLLTTADGERITGWYLPPAKTAGRAGAGRTLLFFHGNAGNLSNRLESLRIFHELGLAVLIIDYRGFGASTGKPSVNGTILDAEAAWAWLREEKGLKPEQIVIFGRSLGGGVAATLAAKVVPGGLILESTFTSLRAVAGEMFSWLPVGLFIPQDYDTPGNLRDLRVPLLVAHSPDDEVVSYRFGESLYNEYAGPKRFLRLHGSHNSGFMQSLPDYMAGLAAFLRGLPPARGAWTEEMK